MKRHVMAIYDAKAQLFSGLFLFVSIGQAARSFEDTVMEEGSVYRRHPEDYSLWHLADYEDATGVVEALQPAVQVMHARDASQLPLIEERRIQRA